MNNNNSYKSIYIAHFFEITRKCLQRNIPYNGELPGTNFAEECILNYNKFIIN